MFYCLWETRTTNRWVILARASRKEEVEEVVQRDPFFQHGIASYQIIEFIPTKHCEAFAPLIE